MSAFEEVARGPRPRAVPVGSLDPRDGDRATPQASCTTWSFESRDPAMTQSHLAGLFGPHAMELPNGTRGFQAHQHGGEVGAVAVHRMTYGAVAVAVTPDPLEDRILVVQPLGGNVGVSSAEVGVVASAQLPAVLDAGRRYRVHWSRGSLAQKVSFDRGMVTEVAAELHGLSASQVAVSFGLGAPVSPTTVVAWSRVAELLSSQLFMGSDNELGSLAQTQLSRAAVAALLDAYPRAVCVQDVNRRPGWVGPRTIDRAVHYIEQNAQDPVRLQDIARDAGLSPRALQVAFRRHYDITPMAFLRDVRLRRAHTELLQADPQATTVSSVAAKWGFLNPGRFATEFREAFGRYPKDALASR